MPAYKYTLKNGKIMWYAAFIIGGNVTGGAVVQGSHHSNVTVSNSERKLTDEETELLRLFNSLDVKRRIKILNLAFALDDEAEAEKNSK